MPPPNSRPSEEKLWQLQSSWRSISIFLLAVIKLNLSRIHTITFSALVYMNFTAFHCATVSHWAGVLEVWTWTYFSAEYSRIRHPKMKKIPQTYVHLPQWGGEHRNTLPLPHPNILSAPAAQDLPHPTSSPKKQTWFRPWAHRLTDLKLLEGRWTPRLWMALWE